jgi:hypothetical protein
MSEVFVKNIPSIQSHEFKYRGMSSSEELNELERQAFSDILDLFNKANILQKDMYEMNMAANIEANCYAKRLEETQTKLAQLEEQYNNLIAGSGDYKYLTRYAFDAIAESNSPYTAIIDKNTADITAAIVNSVSNTRIYDETYDETIVPPSLKVYIGPDSFNTDNEHILSIEDSNVNNAFDGNLGSTWFRKVITDTTVESIENEVIIGLPEDIITSRLVNQIIVYPYPSGYVDVMAVQYKTNGSWQNVPGFTNHAGVEEEEYQDTFGNTLVRHCIKDSSNLKFNFSSLQTNQIRIKLRQRNFIFDAENNRRVWYLGLRDLDVNYNRYTRDHSEFNMVFDFPETENNIKVYDVEIQCNNGFNQANQNELTNEQSSIYKEFFYYDSDGNTHKIASSCPFILNGHKLLTKFTVEGVAETPNIHSCKVKYKLS